MMNQSRERNSAYVMLGIYAIVGAITRFFITYPCGSYFNDIHVFTSYFAIAYIVIGIGFGLYAFVLPNRNRNRIAQGIVTGLAVGFSGTTAVFLVTNPCI
jgi:hypothetical protein